MRTTFVFLQILLATPTAFAFRSMSFADVVEWNDRREIVGHQVAPAKTPSPPTKGVELPLFGKYKVGDQDKHFHVRQATLHDVSSVENWLDDENSMLKKYSMDEIAFHIQKRELFLATSTDNQGQELSPNNPVILASLVVNLPDKSDAKKLLSDIAGLPDNLVKKVPENLIYISGFKMDEDFSKRRGQLGGKKCLSVGATFIAETARMSARKLMDATGSNDFALTCGTSLESLTTLHLSSTIQNLIFRVPDLDCRETIVKSHTIPGTLKSQALFTMAIGKRVPNHDSSNSGAGAFSSSAMQFVPPVTMVHGKQRPGLVDIYPETIEELESTIKKNVETTAGEPVPRAPIGVVSTGKRWGATNKSDQVPTLRLNLSKLNRIHMTDLANGVIIVEPGVTQGDVSDALAGSGWYLPVTGSCRHSSIVGNAIDGGMTSGSLRIDQVIGVQAISDTGKKTKAGVLSSKFHGHGYHLCGGVPSANFLFGKGGIVTRMALRLQRLPKYICAGTILASDEAIEVACELHRQGDLAWWQLRVEPNVGPVLIVKHHGNSESSARNGVQHFFETLGEEGQVVFGSTDQGAEPTVEGKGLFPEQFVKSGFDYFKGIPQCHSHRSVIGTNTCSETPSDGKGFRLVAYAVPENHSVISLLQDNIRAAAAQNEGVEETITVTPMNQGTMYFLVWATFDRASVGVEESFFLQVNKLMSAAGCPKCRYQ